RRARILPLVEFVQMPLRRRRMEMRHTLPGKSSHALRHDHRQPFDHAALLLCQTARLKPKNSTGQGTIDARLSFLVVHSHDGEGALSLAQQATQVGRTEG